MFKAKQTKTKKNKTIYFQYHVQILICMTFLFVFFDYVDRKQKYAIFSSLEQELNTHKKLTLSLNEGLSF